MLKNRLIKNLGSLAKKKQKKYFKLERGVGQGDPVHAHCFRNLFYIC